MVGHLSRRRRRGKLRQTNSNSNNFKKWTLYHVNIRSIESKLVSLKSILHKLNPNVVTINETHLKSNKKVKLSGYHSYSRNRKDKSFEGIATCVIEEDSDDCIKVDEGDGNNEVLVTRHSQFFVPINIINVYGKQENRSSVN